MASYQIKSTPYLRRIINSSKNNGQLQDLREEYERIQEFNDRTIEMKMRQVRLKRLFRQIEGLKVLQASPSLSSEGLTISSRPFVVNPSAPDATQRQRFEALARAREFGKEISRRNAMALQQGGGLHRFGLRSTSKMRASAEARRAETERRERTFARINYGNAQSRCNIQKITERRMRNRQLHRTRAGSETTGYHLHPELSPSMDLVCKDKRTKLQHRLAYGNAQSFSNKERAAAAAAAISVRRTAAATAAATDTTNTMVNPMGSDMLAIANYYDNDDADTMNSTDEDDYEDFQSAMLLTPTPSPHDLCHKKTMILSRDVGGSYFDQLREDNRINISATRLRALGNWQHLITLAVPWISLLQQCRKYVDIFGEDESGTNLFLSATDTSTNRQPIINMQLTLTSESFQDILSVNDSTVINSSETVDGARAAIMNGININTQRQGNYAAAAAAAVSIPEVMEGGEEVSETEEINSDGKYPRSENEYVYFEDDELDEPEADSPISEVKEPSSETDNVFSKIGNPNLSLIEQPVSNTEDQASVPIDDVEQVDNGDQDTMNSEELWHTAPDSIILTKSGVQLQPGNVTRLRKVFDEKTLQ